MNNEKGFSIIELGMIILFVIILTSISIPAFFSKLPRMHLNGAARGFMGDLLTARMEAVCQRNRFQVFFNNIYQYQILDDDDNDGLIDPNEWTQINDLRDNYNGIRFHSFPSLLTFYPRGTTDALEITLKNDKGEERKITLNIAGHVRIE